MFNYWDNIHLLMVDNFAAFATYSYIFIHIVHLKTFPLFKQCIRKIVLFTKFYYIPSSSLNFQGLNKFGLEVKLLEDEWYYNHYNKSLLLFILSASKSSNSVANYLIYFKARCFQQSLKSRKPDIPFLNIVRLQKMQVNHNTELLVVNYLVKVYLETEFGF